MVVISHSPGKHAVVRNYASAPDSLDRHYDFILESGTEAGSVGCRAGGPRTSGSDLCVHVEHKGFHIPRSVETSVGAIMQMRGCLYF